MSAEPNQKVIEGTWDEIVSHASEFNGHRLRVVVLDDQPNVDTRTIEERMAALEKLFSLARKDLNAELDISREGISGPDDWRG